LLADLAILEERKVLQCRQGFAESKSLGMAFGSDSSEDRALGSGRSHLNESNTILGDPP
jgi:hypothetical protein